MWLKYLKDVQDDQFISNIFMRARSKAQIFGSSVTLPRGLARSNSKFIGREEIFYKENIFIPYYQWLVDQLNTRFLKHKEKVFTLQNLLPSNDAKMPFDQLQNVL